MVQFKIENGSVKSVETFFSSVKSVVNKVPTFNNMIQIRNQYNETLTL